MRETLSTIPGSGGFYRRGTVKRPAAARSLQYDRLVRNPRHPRIKYGVTM